MPSVNNATQLTPVERFSLTAKCVNTLARWDNKEKNKIIWQIAARVIGVVLVVFSILADFFIHAFLAFGKSVIALPVMPFRIILQKTPRDLHLASIVVHLRVCMKTGAEMFTIPLTILLDLKRAHRMVQTDGINPMEVQVKIKNIDQVHLENQRNLQLQLDQTQKELLAAKKLLENAEQRIVVKPLQVLDEQSLQLIKKLEDEKLELQRLSDEKMEVLNQQLADLQKQIDNEEEIEDLEFSIPEMIEEMQKENELEFSNETIDEDDLPAVDENGRNETEDEIPSNVARNLMDDFGETPKRNLDKGSPTKGQSRSGGGIQIIPEDGSRKQLLEIISTKKFTLRPTAKKMDEKEVKLQKEIKDEIDQANLMHGPRLQKYGKMIKMLIGYCDAMVNNSPQKVDCEEYHPFHEKAEGLIKKINNQPTVAKEKLQVFQKVYEHLEPTLKEYKNIKVETHKNQLELAEQERLRIEAELKAEKERTKKENLQKLNLIDVKALAENENNLNQTNQIIRDSEHARKHGIHNFPELVEKIKHLKQEISKEPSTTPLNPKEEIRDVLNVLDQINDFYSHIYRVRPTVFIKENLLHALTFIKVEDEAFKKDGNMSSRNTLKIIKDNFDKDYDLQQFKNWLQELRNKIEAGIEIDEKKNDKTKIDKEKFDKTVTVIGLLNEGKYLSGRTNSLIFTKPQNLNPTKL